MSLSNTLRVLGFSAVVLASGAFLGACSFQPVYSGVVANQPMLNLAYAKPASRLEQVVYQEFSLRLGASDAPTAPLAQVAIALGSGGMAPMTDTVSGVEQARVEVTATLTLTRRDGSTDKPLVISRRATAQYTTNDQVFANSTAATEAQERAAKAAAESLRLALLAALSRG
ncbi:MAG: hypothetical protein P0Y65_18795 [Candidatus Devosia phytovorans]|uniref:LPS-assembly lipoprotein n=1 Tax=Candidatus Devosia phytovorans TaxID=3121372 RepID=A0AAJ5VVK3_9HYPH|nr:hypothetical protein [Devosia sp.]WEK04204.1 MAG: hypothetical protein P0Y65_18795 [Devosia sp.]